jgi:glutamine---fructose-6-phosphate transaminase (isomerizing)
LTSLMFEEACAAPLAVAEQLGSDGESYRDLAQRLQREPPTGVVTVARGSSDHAAGYLAYLCAVRGGRVVGSLPMSLVTLHKAPLLTQGMLAIAVSQSGGSPDLLAPMNLFRRGGGTTVALVNDSHSALAQAAQWVLPLHAGAERSVAATKSFICSMTAAARLVGTWFQQADLLAAINDLPDVLTRAVEQDWSAAIDVLGAARQIMVIGRGTGLPLALEAALKFKETCGIQAEAFSGAEVQHGPMALVQDGYPMLIFAPAGPAQAGLLGLADDLRQLGAEVLLAAPADVPERQLTLVAPPCDDLAPLVAVQSFYVMVEALARARGMNPDRPPHLRKITATL